MVVRLLRWLFGVLGIVGLVVVLLLLIRPTVDLEPIRGQIEAGVSAVVESPSTVGSAKLRLGATPELIFTDITIAGRDPLTTPQLGRADSIRVRVALTPLLRREVRILGVRGDGVEFRLERDESGAGNWPLWTAGGDWEVTRVDDVMIEALHLGYRDVTADLDSEIDLDRLRFAVGEEIPFELEMSGRIGESPVELGMSGGTLSELVAGRLSWPFILFLRSQAVRLRLEGRGDLSGGLDAELRAASETRFGKAEWRGRLSTREASVALSGLEATVGETRATGAVSLSFAAERPLLEGSLAVERVDLSVAQSEGGGEGREAELQPGPEALRDALARLQAFDAKLGVTVAEIGGLSAALRRLELDLELADGNLTIPFGFNFGGARVSGVAAMKDPTAVELTLEAEASELSVDPLAQLVGATPAEFAGRVGKVSLLAAASGLDASSLLDTLHLEVSARDLSISTTGPDSVELRLEGARLVHRDNRLTVDLEGDLLGVPIELGFVTTVSLGEPPPLREWPFEIDGEAGDARVDLRGTFAPRAQSAVLEFDLSGGSIAGLAPWLGISERAELPFSAKGALSAAASVWRVDLRQLEIGRSRLEGAVSWRDEPAGRQLAGRVHATDLDPKELGLLIPEAAETDAETLGLDRPLSAVPLPVDEVDLEIEVERLLRETVDLTDLSARVVVREGHLEPSTFRLGLHDADVRGTIALDPTREPPALAVDLEVRDLDLGRLLAAEGLLERLDLTAERLEAHVTAQGATLGEMLDGVELQAVVENARSQLHLGESGDGPVLAIERADIEAAVGSDLRLQSFGTLGELPVEIDLRIGQPADRAAAEPRHPSHLIVRVADNTLRIREEVKVPFDAADLEFDLELEGSGFEELGRRLEIDLPVLGDYRLTGRLHASEGNYTLDDLDLRIGLSDLSGRVGLDTRGERPRLTADLESDRLRVRDLSARGGERNAAPEARQPLEQVEPEAVSDGSAPPTDAARRWDGAMTRPAWMNEFDGRITLAVENFVSGERRLGRLSFDTHLEEGRFDLALDISDPDSADRFRVQLEERNDGVRAQLQTRVERFDYAEFLESIDPGRGSRGGLLSFDVGLTAEVPTWAEIPRDLHGHADFSLYPRGAGSRMLDLWAAGLAQALISQGEAVVNCVVGRFVVADGALTTEDLWIDTSRIRIRGAGKIDLLGDEVALTLRPRPKKPALVNLATPAVVEGSLDEMSIHLSKAGMVRTAFRVSMWFYTAYLELFRRSLPTDGSDICVDPETTAAAVESP